MNLKFKKLSDDLLIMSQEGICIAFSGGIDSSLLLYLCSNLNVYAVTFESVFQTDDEIQETIEFCKKYNIKHNIIKFFPLKDNIISNNPPNRCYYCKKTLFTELKDFARNNNLTYILDGTNFDDIKTYRPGLKALKELNIISPFVKYEITKQEIRDYAKELKLINYNKPSMSCVATRFPYNIKLSSEEIQMVKNGEKLLNTYGVSPCRLRKHNDIARIEIEKDKFKDFLLKKENIISGLKLLGFEYITLDMEGLRSSSMDSAVNYTNKF